MSKISVLMAGGFGGIAPSLVAAANQARVGPGSEGYLFVELPFWVGALASALLGALLVYFYKESSTRKAVALGAAAPSLILGFAGGLPAPQATEHSQTAMAGWVVGVAEAMLPPRAWTPPKPATGDSLWIRIDGLATAGTKPANIVAVYPVSGAAQPGQVPEEITLHLAPRDTLVSVPRSFRSRPLLEVYMTVGGAATGHIAVVHAVKDTLHVNLEVSERSFLSSFGRAFGFRSAPVSAVLKVMPPN